MTIAMGPQRFITDFEGIVNQLRASLLIRAMHALEDMLTCNIQVDFPPEAQPLLEAELLKAGFSKVEFRFDQREGNFIVLYGNPYAATNIEAKVMLCVREINTLLEKAHMIGNKVSVEITVPVQARIGVRDAFIAARWGRVSFTSDMKEGDFVILSI